MTRTRGRSGVTARDCRSTLWRVLGDALRDGLVVRSVASLAHPPEADRRESHVLSAEQTADLIARTTDDPLDPPWAVAATTGLRASDASMTFATAPRA